MKKVAFKNVLVLSLIMLVLSACQSTKGDEQADFTIGINQLAEHPALDAVRVGFEEELKNLGVDAAIDFKNAQSDVANCTKISQKFVEDEVDLILAIATISAQSAKTATSESGTPVLFSAVTDPVSAGLVESMENPQGNLSGTTDMAPMEKQLALFQEINPSIRIVGIIYNTGEINSVTQVEMAEEIGESMGLEIVSVGINNINEVPQATDSILMKADAIYTITDNMVASAISVVAKKANEAGVITIASECSHVESGILMTEGLSYEELGKQTARMAKRILVDKEEISSMPVEQLVETSRIVNMETAKALGLEEEISVFKGAEIIE